MIQRLRYNFLITLLLSVTICRSQTDELEKNFRNPPSSARPWVFWYWMQAAVSKEGITADLEAMKQVGIGGAYLMPIKDTTSPPLYQPTARQLSPEWWQLVNFAMKEAKRLNLKLAMHVSDGFALAGGPWITPAMSMQKLAWTTTYIKGGQKIKRVLAKPATKEDYYKDIAVYAYPANCSNAFADTTLIPSVTTSNGTKANFLSFEDESKESFRSDTTCWIQYKYPAPFTCRSIRIHVGGNNYQAQRLLVQASNDGKNFTTVTRLTPPRHGWQDTDEDVTHAIPATTARYFRFVYNKEGSEPGAEDLDAAKWKPSFKVMGIYLSDAPIIHQYESKNGSIWRVSEPTSNEQVPASSAVPLNKIIRLNAMMDSEGELSWTVPPGNWIVVRIGHTSTGHTNATGGAGKGLECDKFNPVAIKMQFDNWFAKAFEKTDKGLAKEVLKIFHVDSWECGSQNWNAGFAAEFKKRRGYDLYPWLLAMTGVPVQDAASSEKFLHDTRQTIAELVNDVFYKTLKELAHARGCEFSAESVAPTMVSDGLLHYKNTDMPMGEFWLNSPTHDKPNDMLDAISGAHIYGKNIIQAEAFTSVRMNWGEHPGNLKTVGDRNFALGINKMVLHVFTHNPWLNRKPGMTLDGVGLYFQRDQTWFKQSKAWIDYLVRCQALLQMGKPVVDIAVFTGEEIPRRAILPHRLVNTLPGIFGQQKIEEEKIRLANKGEPLRSIPAGVSHSANMADPEDWIDPLNGYAYDSFNPDALMMATVKNGRIALPGGSSYKILVIPGKHPMHPDNSISLAVAKKILQLVKDGATIIIDKDVLQENKKPQVRPIIKELLDAGNKKGKLVLAPYTASSFDELGLQKDVEIMQNDHKVAWTHRRLPGTDIYFIANQEDSGRYVVLQLKENERVPELWNPVSGKIREPATDTRNGRTKIWFQLEANESAFIIFRRKGIAQRGDRALQASLFVKDLDREWSVKFGKDKGGPASPVIMNELISWPQFDDPAIRYYSGTAIYKTTFDISAAQLAMESASLWLDSIFNIATVTINGVDCGTLWTKPYHLPVMKVLREGKNEISIAVSNTWANRLIGDQLLAPDKRITWTTAPFRLQNKPLLRAGLEGRVRIVFSTSKDE